MGFLYNIFFTVFLFSITLAGQAQIIITGTVYDSTKVVPVKEVLVKSNSGNTAVTDTLGHYTIMAAETDSLTFVFNNKPTAKFAVAQIPNIGAFDISLHIRINEKYKLLKEVKVYGKNYRQDSAENRDRYSKIFNYEKPGVSTSFNPYSGAAGLDLDEFINIFRFRRNKQLRKMQERLLKEEQEKYIDYRFNKATVRRVSGLEGAGLDSFMKVYRPDFEFALNSSVVDFYQYILDASYHYKHLDEKDLLINARFNRETVKMITTLEGYDLELFMKQYRPTYEFAKQSGPAEFYDYVLSASRQFKKSNLPPLNAADSLQQSSGPNRPDSSPH